ncbi:LANO_0F06634g1_1 [Lachancea nothofagi CBS 11611]|uniref:SWR1-complex protein 4 n=1 Tax=Lachancea nothofagi CBS 11611 TaxID=1266666 RepID=A0A1G4K8M4_9SACH|nr:LANO_0F06634g1_1 [Lachancea nothofagi CBS 11611]
MASSDIFDVLNIQNPRAGSPGSSGATPGPSRAPKLQVSGMQRELYNLLGDNTPPVAVQKGSKFKDKLRAMAKPSPWTFAEFEPTPSVKLRHWVKGSKELVDQQPQVNAFEKYNTKLTIPEFTEEDYNSFMAGTKVGSEDEEQWGYEEVRQLFDLCRKYDLRWFIVQDRHEGKKPRSLEDMKEAFYLVCHQYFLAKNPDNPLISSLNFSKEKEVERKKYLQRLLSRSAAEIAEEEALIVESKKFEMAAKKTASERETLLRLLDSPNSDKPIAQFLTSQGMTQLYNSLLSDKSKKRKHDPAVPENPWMKQQQQFAQQKQQMQQLQEQKVNSTHVQNQAKKTKKQKQEMQIAVKRKADSEYAEQLLQGFTAEERKSLGVQCHGEKLPSGAYLRSTRVSTFKAATQSKIAATLQELGLPSRPAMPTFEVAHYHDALLGRINSLLDLKRRVDKLEAEKDIKKV